MYINVVYVRIYIYTHQCSTIQETTKNENYEGREVKQSIYKPILNQLMEDKHSNLV
jgi:hypothetical protein